MLHVMNNVTSMAPAGNFSPVSLELQGEIEGSVRCSSHS